MPPAVVGGVLMVALTVGAAAVPVVVVLSNPSTPSCDWTSGGTTGLHLEMCDQHPARLECDGALYGTRYTVTPDGAVRLHALRYVCSGAWVDPTGPITPEPPQQPPQPDDCARDAGMLYGVVWINDQFTLGCAHDVCPADVWVKTGGDKYAPCVLG